MSAYRCDTNTQTVLCQDCYEHEDHPGFELRGITFTKLSRLPWECADCGITQEEIDEEEENEFQKSL